MSQNGERMPNSFRVVWRKRSGLSVVVLVGALALSGCGSSGCCRFSSTTSELAVRPRSIKKWGGAARAISAQSALNTYQAAVEVIGFNSPRLSNWRRPPSCAVRLWRFAVTDAIWSRCDFSFPAEIPPPSYSSPAGSIRLTSFVSTSRTPDCCNARDPRQLPADSRAIRSLAWR